MTVIIPTFPAVVELAVSPDVIGLAGGHSETLGSTAMDVVPAGQRALLSAVGIGDVVVDVIAVILMTRRDFGLAPTGTHTKVFVIGRGLFLGRWLLLWRVDFLLQLRSFRCIEARQGVVFLCSAIAVAGVEICPAQILVFGHEAFFPVITGGGQANAFLELRNGFRVTPQFVVSNAQGIVCDRVYALQLVGMLSRRENVIPLVEFAVAVRQGCPWPGLVGLDAGRCLVFRDRI